MIVMTARGLYCEAGDFYIDPHAKVDRAVITHAHSDHAMRGMASYLAHKHTVPLLHSRLGKKISTQAVEYGEVIAMNGVHVSLHPAGHVAGSSQVRVEHHGEVWVATGDYKRQTDSVSTPFEVVPCHTFITECTFGLPVYQWQEQQDTIHSINEWWRVNASQQAVSVIKAYALGKAQRILSLLDSTIGPVFVSKPIFEINAILRQHGYHLPEAAPLEFTRPEELKGALVITSSSVDDYVDDAVVHTAEVSGWMAVRRHHRSGSKNFVLSDHADWPSLLRTIKETGAHRVLAIHGFTSPLTRYLSHLGYESSALEGGEGRTRSEAVGSLSSIALKKRADVCEQTGLPEWLFDECLSHVQSLSETASLILTGTYQSSRTIDRAQIQSKPEPDPEISFDAVRLKAVLYHIHRQPGSNRIAKLTMGVWREGELVPLAHVDPEITDTILSRILEFTEENTLVKVGPVRTIKPHFVFTVELTGLSIAPRRLIGVRIHGARIIEFHHDLDATCAASVADVHALIR